MKTPKIKAPEEDPQVKAQRLAAEKAATDANNAAVGDILERKTRLKARVFGVAPGGGGSAYAGSASTLASPRAGAGADGRNYSFSSGNIWKGGMF